jgi:serine/threonine protein kinase
MAPELIKDDGGGYGPEVDVWALGLVFYEVLTG